MRKKILKTIGAGLLTCALIFGASACGGSTDQTGDGTIKSPWWKTEGTLKKDGNNIVYEDVELSLATVVTGDDAAPLNQLIARFNQEYKGKIRVTSTPIPQSTYEGAVAQAIQNNSNPPDILMSHQKGHKAFADNKLIQPLNEAIEKSGIDLKTADYAAGLAQYTDLGYEGYMFDVPIDAQSIAVYYNKKILAKYGDKLPSGHTELIDLLKRVAEGEKTIPISAVMNSTMFFDYAFTTAVLQNGGRFYDSENQYKVDWASDANNLAAFKNGIKAMRDIIKSTPTLADFNMVRATALRNFTQGKSLFYFSYPWETTILLDNYAKQNNISVATAKSDYVGATSVANWFNLDESSEDGNKIYGDSHYFAMSKSVTDITKKSAICEFIKWFTQNGSVAAAWGEAGHISACTAALTSPEYLQNDIVNDYINVFYPDINYFHTAGITPYAAPMAEAWRPMFKSAIESNDASSDEALIRAAQKKDNDEIDTINME